MSDEPALLAAILAHPDEDTPRLVYADWLDENGRAERAEFIRIQCAPDADDAAQDRAAELEERSRGRWLTELGLPQFAGALWGWGRGFPEHLDVGGSLFLFRYDAFARTPWLRSLCLMEVWGSLVRDFANRPWNSRWGALELQLHPYEGTTEPADDTPAVVAVANCPQAAQLHRLCLSLFDLNEEGVRALAASPHLGNLHLLQLDGYHGDPFFAPLRERFGDRLVIG